MMFALLDFILLDPRSSSQFFFFFLEIITEFLRTNFFRVQKKPQWGSVQMHTSTHSLRGNARRVADQDRLGDGFHGRRQFELVVRFLAVLFVFVRYRFGGLADGRLE